jgi:3'(2'), 5'-bisphosphate nucleotidase
MRARAARTASAISIGGRIVFGMYREEAEFAIQAVSAGARLARRIEAEMITPAMQKDDRSPVTVADFAVQALVGHMFLGTFKTDPLVAEEGAASLRLPENRDVLTAITRYLAGVQAGVSVDEVCRWIDRGAADPAERFWTLDPVDGTKGFLRGDQYVVAMALIEAGRVVLGALGCPQLRPSILGRAGAPGVMLVAARGAGSWCGDLAGRNLDRLAVSACSQASQARLLRSMEAGHTDVEKMARFVSELGIQEPPVQMDSQAKFAVLAAGGAELIVRMLSPERPHYSEFIWDQAAGSVILEEAGGQVSDLRGKPLDFSAGKRLYNNIGVLASNRALHSAALHALHRVSADRRPPTDDGRYGSREKGSGIGG